MQQLVTWDFHAKSTNSYSCGMFPLKPCSMCVVWRTYRHRREYQSLAILKLLAKNLAFTSKNLEEARSNSSYAAGSSLAPVVHTAHIFFLLFYRNEGKPITVHIREKSDWVCRHVKVESQHRDNATTCQHMFARCMAACLTRNSLRWRNYPIAVMRVFMKGRIAVYRASVLGHQVAMFATWNLNCYCVTDNFTHEALLTTTRPIPPSL